ncbi:MAG: hypothetical protein KF760_27605 [Candidatus Eremiobacteraeota bacterium]|nr:hypothetical protein [Candidatus Eremiobacteraeota bacterium]MCW5871040.1 hypothetical protein [Candidatus Eremiobacteraeota bacterium]
MMRQRGLGLLFGPREGGCWEFLLCQAWLSGLAASAVAWFTGSRWIWEIARGFLSEAVVITLLLASVAQALRRTS